MKTSEKLAVFRYPKTRFISRGVVIAMVMLFTVLMFRALSPELLLWFILLIVLLSAFFAVYGISPMFTTHWLTRSRLILRQGIYFKCVIPLREIEKVEAYDAEMRIGLALSWRSSILFVTSSRYELVEVKLKRPRRFWQVLGFAASRIVFNVEKRGELLSLIEERMASLAPVKADRPDA